MLGYFLSQIAEECDFVPKKVTEKYCSGCVVCTLKRTQHVTAPLQLILTSNFIKRLQLIEIDRIARTFNIFGATEVVAFDI